MWQMTQVAISFVDRCQHANTIGNNEMFCKNIIFFSNEISWKKQGTRSTLLYKSHQFMTTPKGKKDVITDVCWWLMASLSQSCIAGESK